MQLLQFSTLKSVAGLHHAITTREGGVSKAGFESLNLAFHVGDDEIRVRRNRCILAARMDYDPETLVAAKQIHQSRTHLVFSDIAGRGALDSDAIPDTDALVTKEKNLPLLILVADCAPILIVDPEERVLAVVHAGWRGALAGIAGKTVAKMRHDFGSRPNDILVGIGPCLSVENFEIGPEVAAEVEKVDARAVVAGWEKPHLDLRALIGRDLQRAGVLETNIEIMPFCTKDDARFFSHRESHRGQNGVAGRFGVVAWFSA